MGRRRQAETKDEKVDVTTGAPQQASLLPVDRVLHYVNVFQDSLAKRETLNGRYRAARKACKAEGIAPEEIDEAIQLKRGDPNEFRQRYQRSAQILKIMGAPFQLQIFDTRFNSAIEQAKYEGAFAGAGGHNMDCRWPEGSPEAAAYVQGYQEEQAKHVPGADTVSEKDLVDAVNKPELANRDPVEQPAQ